MLLLVGIFHSSYRGSAMLVITKYIVFIDKLSKYLTNKPYSVVKISMRRLHSASFTVLLTVSFSVIIVSSEVGVSVVLQYEYVFTKSTW